MTMTGVVGGVVVDGGVTGPAPDTVVHGHDAADSKE